MATLAGPSRSRAAPNAAKAKPAPTRTLKQPIALNVAERTAGAVAVQSKTDAAQLRTALEHRAGIARRAEKWMDKAMEEVLGVSDFQKALSYMHATKYAEVQHERHLNGLCAYPLCGNAPAAPYRSHKRFVVSTARRTITEKDGNDEQAFCGRKCAARSAWVAASLGTEAAWIRGKVDPVLLLEDKEALGEVSWGGRRGDVLMWNNKDKPAPAPAPAAPSVPAVPVPAPAPTPAPAASVATAIATLPTTTRAAKAAPALEATKPAVVLPPTAATASAPAPPPAAAPLPAASPLAPGGMADLAASLSIVERETPRARPMPPSKASTYVEQGRVISAGGVTLPLPLPSGGILSNSVANAVTPTVGATNSGAAKPTAGAVSGKSRGPAQRTRAAGALLGGGTTKIASQVLAASKTIKAQQDEDSSDEGSASEEEWAKDMGWGAGAEVDALFAEARKAREML